jgi:V/A-type H+-transporting ATPase subunit I
MASFIPLETKLSDIGTGRRAAALVGTLPTSAVPRTAPALEQRHIPSHVEVVTEEETRSLVLVVVERRREAEARSVLLRLDFGFVTPPRLDRTAVDAIRDLEKRKGEIADELHRLPELVRLRTADVDALAVLHDALLQEQLRHVAGKNFVSTDRVFLLEGWMRRRDLERVRRILAGRCPVCTLLEVEPEKGETPPVELRNVAVVRPFELVTEMYDTPKPGEADPTPLFAFFFATFFGICLMDAGYGLLLLPVGWLMRNKLKWRQLGSLSYVCSGATIVAGILTGSYFGMSFESVPSWLSWTRDVREFLMLLDPLRDTMRFFVLALSLGFVHIMFGTAIKAWAVLRSGDIFAFVADEVPKLVITPAIVLFALHYLSLAKVPVLAVKIAWGAFVPSAVSVAVFSARGAESLPERVVVGAMNLYLSISGVLGDILSYSRLLALGLAGSVIALVVNVVSGVVFDLLSPIPIVGRVLGAIGYVAILVVGHVGNLFISSLGAFVHTMRLQFVEFFQKFYEGGGRAFAPFREERVYTVLKDENVA